MVRDDVVHLAGDPGALGGRGQCDLLVSLTFQPLRAVVQFGQIGAPGREVQAEPERGGDQPGQEDRVGPPVAAGQPDRPGDNGQLEHGGARQRLPARPHAGDGIQGDEQGHAVDRVEFTP